MAKKSRMNRLQSSICTCDIQEKRYKYPYRRREASCKMRKLLTSLRPEMPIPLPFPENFVRRRIPGTRRFPPDFSRNSAAAQKDCIGKTTAHNVHRSGMPHDTFTPVRALRALDTYVIAMISHRGWRPVVKRARFSRALALYSRASMRTRRQKRPPYPKSACHRKILCSIAKEEEESVERRRGSHARNYANFSADPKERQIRFERSFL